MRLTLRTLLAYLDDTLPPAEIKQIGQKVAESDAAQELIARIKQVTRRRRLTTPPPSGPGGKLFDANTVAEYLDNELEGDAIAEVEKLCLESDVHLAEIAACHQILTLVLGEPALVPPTARERMYGLVKGREAIPYRKATPQPAAAAAGGEEGEDDGLLGLPLGGKNAWLTVGLPLAAGALVVLVLLAALWRAVTPGGPASVASVTPKPPPDKGGEVARSDGAKEPAKEEPKAKDDRKAPEKAATTPEPKGEPASKAPEGGTTTPEPPRPPEPPAGAEPRRSDRPAPPAAERRELATYSAIPKSLPSMLVSRPKDGADWRRVSPGSRIASTDLLVSLPGSPSELRLDSGVRLQLWGMLYEFLPPPVPDSLLLNSLLESAAVLHVPPAGFDLDVTLQRGRFFISNSKTKGPTRLRLRFDNEVWDVTLQEPGTEVSIDFGKNYRSDIDWQSGEEPVAELVLFVLSGRASLRVDFQEFPTLTAPPGPAMFYWDNKGAGARGPTVIPDRVPTLLSKELPPMPPKEAEAMRQALEDIAKEMVDKKPVDVVLQEVVQSNRPLPQRTLCILSLGAIDEVRQLLDVLSSEDPAHAPDRNAAIYTLRRWVSRSAAHGRMIYDPKAGTGLLVEKKYRPGEAATILELLYPFSDVKRRQVETFETLINLLRSDKIAIRELAYWHLYRLAQGVIDPKRYNPAMLGEQREAAVAEFHKLVKEGKLPPPPPAPAPPR